MDIKEIQQSFMLVAAGLGDYQLLTKTELANGYCDADEAKDELGRSQYWAALMLRYWYKIFEWAKNSESCRLQLEDFVSWLNDSLCDAFYYRSWRWEYEAVVQNGKFVEWKFDENGNKIPNEHYWKIDPNAPDKSINYFCAARRGKEYQALNKQKRRCNVVTYSLDANQEENGDGILEAAGAVSYMEQPTGIQGLVKKFISQGRDIEALILDGIACQDSFKENKTSHYEIDVDEETGEEYKEKVYTYSPTFDPRKLVKHLNAINQAFMRTYFNIEYEISLEEGEAILVKLKSLNNTKLYNYIKKTLTNLKNDPDLFSYLLK